MCKQPPPPLPGTHRTVGWAIDARWRPLWLTSATPRQQSPENSCTKATWLTMSRLPARLMCSQEFLYRPNLHVSSSRHAAQLHESEKPDSQEPAPLPLSCSPCVCAPACVRPNLVFVEEKELHTPSCTDKRTHENAAFSLWHASARRSCIHPLHT